MDGRKSSSSSEKVLVMIDNRENGMRNFRIKRSSQIEKLIQAYCKIESLDVRHVSFIYHDEIIQGKQTVVDLGIVDGDNIISAKIAAEKKGTRRDSIIKQLEKDLQRVNAEISTLSRKRSRISEELLNVEISLLEANKEMLKVRKELESAKRPAALEKLQHKRKRAHLGGSIKIQQSEVARSCSVGKDEDDSNWVYLQFIDHTGKSLYFKCRKDAQMLKVMDACCSRGDKDLKSFTFKFNDNKIETYQTPKELQMKDGDKIQVVPTPER